MRQEVTKCQYVVDKKGKYYKREKIAEEECGDCGRIRGQYHMENCDQERCPHCGLQLLMCEEIESYAHNKP